MRMVSAIDIEKAWRSGMTLEEIEGHMPYPHHFEIAQIIQGVMTDEECIADELSGGQMSGHKSYVLSVPGHDYYVAEEE